MGKIVVIKNIGEFTVKFRFDETGDSDCLLGEDDIRTMFANSVKKLLEDNGLEDVEVVSMNLTSEVEELN